jgi:mannose-6-phosphate isomerase-like protein (cupin superfamily)
MDIRSFLKGKVQIKSLPVVTPPDGGMTEPRRISLSRGELAVLTDGQIPITHLAYVELKDRALRGNHFHKLRHEYFYLIAGQAELWVQDLATNERTNELLKAGDLAFIEPNIAHAFIPHSAGHGLEFAREKFDPADVYKHPVYSD